jgi:hypothetical protein
LENRKGVLRQGAKRAKMIKVGPRPFTYGRCEDGFTLDEQDGGRTRNHPAHPAGPGVALRSRVIPSTFLPHPCDQCNPWFIFWLRLCRAVPLWLKAVFFF